MLIRHSYDSHFVNLLQNLQKKYGEEMFKLEGIDSDNLDISKFTQKFLDASTPTADKSIDGNANVDDQSILNWEYEFPKPLMKLNGLYTLWKDALSKHGIKRANKMIESEICGAIRIHDLHAFLKPYCWASSLQFIVNEGMPWVKKIKVGPIQHFDTFVNNSFQYVCELSTQLAGACLPFDQKILIKQDERIKNINIGDLVESAFKNNNINQYENYEYVNVNEDLNVKEDGKFVSINRLYRRKYSDKIYKFTTDRGYTLRTSKDHKFKTLCKGKVVETTAENIRQFETVYISKNFKINKYSDEYRKGQFYGILMGDGCLTKPNEINVAINYKQTFIADFLDDYCQKKYNEVGKLRDGNKCYNWSIYNKDIKNEILKNFEGLSCYDKIITISGNEDFYAGLLDGLLVTDGVYNKLFVFFSVNRNIINLVKQICDYFGICCEEQNHEKSHFMKADGWDLFINVANTVPYLSLMVDKLNQYSYVGDYTVRCQSKIGKYAFGKTKYDIRTKQQLEKNKYDIALDNNLDVITNIEIENYDHEYVYELETETHWYSVGNIITHNCALPDFFPFAEFFVRKDFGNEWDKNPEIVENIKQQFQKFIYSVNQKFRGNQSPFTNITVCDKYWLKGLFGKHTNPDFSSPDFDNLMKVQKVFVEVLIENLKDNPFTFPVMTAAQLKDKETGELMDKEWLQWIAEMTKENAVFNFYTSDSVDSLSSCCRLRNQLQPKGLKEKEYTNSFGVGGTNIGSHRVVAINLPQIAYIAKYSEKDTWSHFWNILRSRISLSQDILDIHKDRLIRQINMGLIPLYKYGCIDINKQYSTLGFIGLYECLEIMGLDVTTNDGIQKGKEILEIFNKMNDKRTEEDGHIRNVEQIPGEAAAVTFAKKDSLQFAMAEYKMYSNQYIPLTKEASIIDRIFVHGQFDSDVGGGSILHLDVDQELTVDQIKDLIQFAAKKGVIYFAIDNPFSQCSICGKTFIGKFDKSPCHQAETRKFMRVVGFRTDVSGWNKERRIEFKNRYCYHDFELE